MPTSDADIIRRRVQAAKARKSLEFFTTHTYSESGVGQYRAFEVGWHHRVIFERLEAWQRGDVHKLIITTPPRRGKSEIVCRRLAPWLLGHNPKEEVLFITHTTNFAETQGLDVQRVMESKRYGRIFDTEMVSPTRKGFRTKEGGGFSPLGIREGSAGLNASRVIIDDYHRNREDARSQASRDRVWESFTDDLLPRLYYPASVIVMATRWHHDDLIGRILQSPEAEDWEVIHLPEIMDLDSPPPYDPRDHGEPLFPWWFKGGDESVTDGEAAARAVEHYERILARNAFTAESLYQGRPTPRSGGLFKREYMQHYAADPRRMAQTCSEILISVDASFKRSSGSDYVAALVLGRRDNEYFLLDEIHDRMDYPETKRALRALAAKWPRASILIETKANGEALVSELRRELNRVIGFSPTDSKESRAQLAADSFEAKQVWLPSPAYAPWIGDFIEDFTGFPGRAHDDRIDAFSQAMIRWTKNGGALAHLRRICAIS